MTGSSTRVKGLLLVMLLMSSPAVVLAALVPFVQQFETREAVKVRSAPDSGADVVATLSAGSQVRSKKRSTDGRWIQVRLQQPAVTGYVRTRHLQRRSTASKTDSRIDLPAKRRPLNQPNDPLAEAIRRKGTASLDLGELAQSGQIEMQHAENARERQRELAEQRRARKKAERERREAEEARQRQQELAEQRRRERERAAQAQSSGTDWWGIVNQVVQSTAEINRIKQENAARTRQLADQARREQQRQQQYRQQQQAAQQRQAQSQREQWQRQQQAAAAERRRQQIAAQKRRQREQLRLAEQQRRATQKLLAQSAGAVSSGNTGGGSSSYRSSGSGSGTSTSTGSGSGSSSGKKQKVYEPMPQVVTSENSTWFSDRDRAIAYARLKSVNDIDDLCRAKDARSDGPRFSDIEQGDAPSRWSYAVPDCRQGGWKGEEWKCSAEVRGHCYRMQ